MKTIILLFLFCFSYNVYSQTNTTKFNIDYSLAIHYKDLAAISTNKQDIFNNLEKSKVILEKITNEIQSPEIFFDLGEVYQGLEDYESSIKMYKKVALLDFNNDNVNVLLGELYFFLKGDVKKSKYYFSRALQINPFNNNALIVLGVIDYENAEYSKAVKYFERVDINRGGSLKYLVYYDFYYAVSQFYLGLYNEAAARIENLSSEYLSHEDRVTAGYILVKSLQALEKFSLAYKASIYIAGSLYDDNFLVYACLLSVLADEYKEEIFDKVYSTFQNVPRFIDIIYIAKNDGYEKAIEMLQIEFSRGSTDIDLIQLYYYLVQKVGNDEQKKESEIGIIIFYSQMAIFDSIKPHLEILDSFKNSEKYNNLYLTIAYGYYDQGLYEKSRDVLEEYLKINSTDEKARESLVSILIYKTKEYDRALEIINSMDNKFKIIYESFAYYKKNDYKKVSQLLTDNLYNYERLANIDFDNYNKAFSIVLEMDDKDLAIKYTKYLYDEYLDDVMYHNNYAWVLIELDIDIDKGIEIAKKGLKQDPKNIYFLDTLAVGLSKKGEYGDALTMLFKAAIYSENNNVEIITHIADVYYKLGSLDKALYYYRMARSITENDAIFKDFHVDRQIEYLTGVK